MKAGSSNRTDSGSGDKKGKPAPGRSGTVQATPARKSAVPVPIVAIGASAGGLEALETFFSNMPADSGLAFIVIQHVAPTGKSNLVSLLRRYTSMKTAEAQDGVKLQPNTIYVNRPDKQVAFLHGAIRLMEPQGHHATWMPIDYCFRSLAQELRERAIGLVFSGTGTDGSQGLKAINGEGGIVMVQEPDQAHYDGMPRSAIGTGLVDSILPVEKIPSQLLKVTQHPYLRQRELKGKKVGTGTLQKIFLLIRHQTGHDFSQYKRNTVLRRVRRRMVVHHLESIATYYQFLQANAHEVWTLFRDLLIGVTSFLRDPEAFEVLQKQVIPQLVDQHPEQTSFRVWVVGCSSGEEAYSIAIAFKEYALERKQNLNVQIFATDIDSEAIEKARRGIYPCGIVQDVREGLLKRYFYAEDNSYRIKKEIRDMVVFAEQNVIRDPPFSNLDLISCRNLLIYLEPELQKKILVTFHYAMNPEAILFMGPSETLGNCDDLFGVLDGKWKFFRRKKMVSGYARLPRLPLPLVGIEPSPRSEEKWSQHRLTEQNLKEYTQHVLLDRYAPACVVVDENWQVIYTHGRTGSFLELSPGPANLKVTQLAREGLRSELTSALRLAVSQNQEMEIKNIQVKTNGGFQGINLRVIPFLNRPEFMTGLVMVAFECIPTPEETGPSNRSKKGQKAQQVQALESELQNAKERLQTTVEELETSNEELKSTNEELQSSNEELQSANEELETSKEELESTNEELLTVNREHQEKIQELSRVNDDMQNLLASTEVATMFLDNDLRVKRFSPETHRLIQLIQLDIGRPITQIASNLKYEELARDAREVLRTLKTHEREVQAKDGNWFLIKMGAYRTVENVIEGVVVSFTDITGRKRIQEELEKIKDENNRLRSELEGRASGKT